MPLIGPPVDRPDDSIPETVPVKNDWDEYRRIQLFLNCRPWLCSCGLTNFGRNKLCAKWTCKKPRPLDWKPR